MQPLKDTFFQFLFVAFVASCAAWQRAWVGPSRWTARIGTSALLAVLLYAAASIRWYFALVLLIAASLFLLLTAIRTAERKLPALAAAVVVAFVLSRGFVAGSGPQLTPEVRAAFTPGAFAAWQGRVVKLWRAEVADPVDAGPPGGATPGEVVGLDERGVQVACGRGVLRLLEVQPESRPRQPAPLRPPEKRPIRATCVR